MAALAWIDRQNFSHFFSPIVAHSVPEWDATRVRHACTQSSGLLIIAADAFNGDAFQRRWACPRGACVHKRYFLRKKSDGEGISLNY